MVDEVWQAYDCPVSGIDFDLHNEHLVHQGQRFHCCGCGGEHVAGVDVRIETCIEMGEERKFCDLPASDDELARMCSPRAA